MQCLKEFSHILIKSLKLRQKYMTLSHQYIPKTVKKYLERYILDENSNEISNLTQRMEHISIEKDGIYYLFTFL